MSAAGYGQGLTEPRRRAMSEHEGSRTRWSVVAVLITAILAVATVVAVTADRGGDRKSDPRRRVPPPSHDQLLASQTKSSPSSERCLKSLLTVERAGLSLRDETEFRCPGIAAEPGEEHHWGATCWQNELCPGGSYIAIDEALIGPDDARLRYVIAHEICHVNSYLRTGHRGSEAEADECAAGAGFPKV